MALLINKETKQTTLAPPTKLAVKIKVISVSVDQGGRFPPFSGDFLKQLFTLISMHDGISFVSNDSNDSK